ncbi:hypothetical protein [Caproiciproducens sp.]
MKNRCKNMMEKIKAPSSLKDKVLSAACNASFPVTENIWRQPKRHTVFRTAVCAVCAFAVLLGGGFFLSKPGIEKISNEKGAGSSLSPAYHFGLVAYAADINKTFEPQDNKIAFSVSNAGGGEIFGKGDYTGCLFRVTGDEIKTLNITIDRGGLYRYQKVPNLTKDEIKAIYAAEANGTLKADCQFASSDDEKTWCSEQMTALGSSFSENWTADSVFGFWVPPESTLSSGEEDPREAAHKNIDIFNGATLRITATFRDGSQQTKSLNLKTGKLKIVYGENHIRTVLPELAGENDPYVYSVYAKLEN